MNLYFWRHGQSLGNFYKILQGTLDYPLTDLGTEQAKNLGEKLSHLGLDFVLSSTSTRAFNTAKIAVNNLCPIYCDDRLKEIYMGEHQGKFSSKVQIILGEEFFKEWRSGNENSFKMKMPGSESREDVYNRSLYALKDFLKNNPCQHLGISTHGGVIKSILLKTFEFNIPEEINYIDNCDLLHFSFNNNQLKFISKIV